MASGRGPGPGESRTPPWAPPPAPASPGPAPHLTVQTLLQPEVDEALPRAQSPGGLRRGWPFSRTPLLARASPASASRVAGSPAGTGTCSSPTWEDTSSALGPPCSGAHPRAPANQLPWRPGGGQVSDGASPRPVDHGGPALVSLPVPRPWAARILPNLDPRHQAPGLRRDLWTLALSVNSNLKCRALQLVPPPTPPPRTGSSLPSAHTNARRPQPPHPACAPSVREPEDPAASSGG